MTYLDRLVRALLLRRKHAAGLATHEARRSFLKTMVVGGITLPFAEGVLERIALGPTPWTGGCLTVVGVVLHSTVCVDGRGYLLSDTTIVPLSPSHPIGAYAPVLQVEVPSSSRWNGQMFTISERGVGLPLRAGDIVTLCHG